MKRVYLDSNVFISLFNREVGRNVRGLFVEAESFIEQVKKQDSVLVLSKLFFEEVKVKCFFERREVLKFFDERGVKSIVVEDAFNHLLGRLQRQGIHFSDSIHAATALTSCCDCIVTFNIKDFEKVREKIKVFEPADFT